MSIQFADAFNQLIREKRIDRELLMETLQAGFASAAKKKHGPNAEVLLEDDGHGAVELYLVKNVVKEVEDDSIEISVEEAQEFAEGAEAGDQIYIFIPFEEFGRNAIQITKQILMQKLREHERERVFAEYHDRTGILVNLGNAEATMPKKEQIRRERYNQGSSIRGVILKVDKEAKGPMIILSRTSPEFLKALFTQEVPEIYEGLIEIKSVAREAGGRSKIAVYSRDDRVDAVGACVGMKGSRVQAVVNELSGERIDIVPWNDDISAFISRALSPAKIASVRSDVEEKTVLVIVEEDQLSLAIGKEGQNVRLASRLSGWNIELVSSRELEQRERLQEQLLMPIEEMVGVSEKMAEKLREMGVNTVQKLIKIPKEELLESPGMGPKTVEKLILTAEGTVRELEKALEEMITKENDDRAREKAAEKPLFDESLLEPDADGDEPEKKLTEAALFSEPVEEEASAETTEADAEAAEAAAEEAPAEEAVEAAEPAEEVAAAEEPAEETAEADAEATDDDASVENDEAEAPEEDPEKKE